jgi:glutamate racemase
VIEPGARAAVAATRNRRVAVIATEGTVQGGAYPRAVAAMDAGIAVEQRACSLLVALAEEGWTDGAVAEQTLARYFDGLFPGPDVLLLGCTHFPVLEDVIRKAAPPDVQLVNSAATTAAVVVEDLERRGLRRAGRSTPGRVHYLVTDNVERFERTARRFLGGLPEHDEIELVDIGNDKEQGARSKEQGARSKE